MYGGMHCREIRAKRQYTEIIKITVERAMQLAIKVASWETSQLCWPFSKRLFFETMRLIMTAINCVFVVCEAALFTLAALFAVVKRVSGASRALRTSLIPALAIEDRLSMLLLMQIMPSQLPSWHHQSTEVVRWMPVPLQPAAGWLREVQPHDHLLAPHLVIAL
jgi:hypothetical protein